MPRLQIASGLFQNLMLLDRDAFFKDPYGQAQRALMLADTLIAGHQMTGPTSMTSTNGSAPLPIDVEVGIRAARANFAAQHMDGSNTAQRSRAN